MRRTQLARLEPAQAALAEGRYDTAYALLEDAARRTPARRTQAQYHLHLAAADALYGPEGVDQGVRALGDAARLDPGCVHDPLYRALHWEFRALQGAAAGDVRRGVRGVEPGEDPVAAYHAASALFHAGAARTARRALLALSPGLLPAYLRWRHASLMGRAAAERGAWAEAAEAYRSAWQHAPEEERTREGIQLASALLELGRVEEMMPLLQVANESDLDAYDRSWARQLAGRAELEMGNPGRALEAFAEAERSAPDEELRLEAVQAAAQALSMQGRSAEAAARLAELLVRAPLEERSFTLHERGVALLDADMPEEAEASLEAALSDPDYPHRAEATADLADARARRGDLAGAQEAGRSALELGAVGPACLTLGHVAYEYFDLDEAVSWFEQAASATTPGEPVWIAAQQFLADVFAQRGPAGAERVLTHARLALAHTDPHSEWTLPLEDHVARARGWLGGHDRLLN